MHIPSKMDELKTSYKNANSLVIGITELKPQNNRYNLSPAEISIPGYDIFHTLPLDTNACRGCVLYVYNELRACEEMFCKDFKD